VPATAVNSPSFRNALKDSLAFSEKFSKKPVKRYVEQDKTTLKYFSAASVNFTAMTE
jgi:hypothetical protein